MSATDKLIDSFASMLKDHGVPIQGEDNKSRLEVFERSLPRRLPQSFESFLSRYSFPAFDVLEITLFSWDSDSNPYVEEATKGILSELLLPAGFVQIGRNDPRFDAVCFDWNKPAQNRESRIVQVDHEDILCNSKVRVMCELFPSFIKLIKDALSTPDPKVYWEEPIV